MNRRGFFAALAALPIIGPAIARHLAEARPSSYVRIHFPAVSFSATHQYGSKLYRDGILKNGETAETLADVRELEILIPSPPVRRLGRADGRAPDPWRADRCLSPRLQARRGFTTKQKVGIAGVIAAVLAAGGVYVAKNAGTAQMSATGAPPGYWKHGNGCLPCSTQSPYTPGVCPDNGNTYYLRYDAVMMEAGAWINVADEAIAAGQGGAAHTLQYTIQTEAGSGRGWIIPLGAQKQGGGWIMAPAPYRDMPMKVQPGAWSSTKIYAAKARVTYSGGHWRSKLDGNQGHQPITGIWWESTGPMTLCDQYRDMGGTATCSSGVAILTYANQMKTFTEWVGAWPTVNNTQRIPQCSAPQPTPPPITALPPTVTPSLSGHPLAAWVQAFKGYGWTAGCGGGNFCPDRPVRLEEVHIWLSNNWVLSPAGTFHPMSYDHAMTRAEWTRENLRAIFGGNYSPPSCVPPGPFLDVPCSAN